MTIPRSKNSHFGQGALAVSIVSSYWVHFTRVHKWAIPWMGLNETAMQKWTCTCFCRKRVYNFHWIPKGPTSQYRRDSLTYHICASTRWNLVPSRTRRNWGLPPTELSPQTISRAVGEIMQSHKTKRQGEKWFQDTRRNFFQGWGVRKLLERGCISVRVWSSLLLNFLIFEMKIKGLISQHGCEGSTWNHSALQIDWVEKSWRNVTIYGNNDDNLDQRLTRKSCMQFHSSSCSDQKQ